MSNYLTLVKTLLIMRFRRAGNTAKQSKTALIVLYALLGVVYLFVMGSACVGVVFVTPIIKEMGALSEVMLTVCSIGVALVICLGTVTMLSYVYFNRDTEFLSTLPVKSGTIFYAKISIVFLYEFVTTAAVILPPLLCMGIAGGLNALFYIAIVFALFLVPAIPMFISSIIAIPLMYVVSFFKSRAMLSTIVFVLVFAFVMIGYYLLMGNLNFDGLDTPEALENLVRALQNAAKPLEYALFPLYMILCFGTMTPIFGLSGAASGFLSFFLSLVTTAAMLVIAYLISNAVYSRGVRAQLENRKKQVAAKGTFEVGKVGNAIIKKEFKYLFRVPYFGFQCLSGVVICPVIILAYKFMMSSMSDGGAASVSLYPIVYFMLIALGGGMNTIACSAIDREGSSFSILKALPLEPKTIVNAKLQSSLIVCYLASALGMLALLLYMPPVYDYFALMAMIAVYVYANACFALSFNIKHFNLHWSSPTDAVKRSKNVTVPTLINIAVGIGFMLIFIVKGTLLSMFATAAVWINLIFWTVLLVGVVIYAVLAHKMLYTNLDEKWNKIA